MKDVYDGLGMSALLVCDPHTVMYFTGIEFPFATHFPEKPVGCIFTGKNDPVLLCPYEWGRAALDQGWSGNISTYTDNNAENFSFIADKTAEVLKSEGLEKADAGIEESYIPAALADMLRDRCPTVRWTAADAALAQHRMIKNADELELMRTAAEQLEFGLIGALQHLEGSLEENGYTLAEFCERIRVHVYETGGTAGGLAAVSAGSDSAQWYARPVGKFIPGELVRIEASSRYMGLWAVTSRMMTIGAAAELQVRAYEENLVLKRRALEMLSPGVKASSIFEAVAEIAAAKSIDFRGEFGAGHGLGAGEMEAPYLNMEDDTTLREGMCIVLAVYTEGPRKELVCVKDTYYLGTKGPVCISSFHNWDSLYEVTGFRSAH